jgi:hypothetical protein
MRKSLLTLGVVAVAILLATSASAANRGVDFTGIGFHPLDIGQSYTPASAVYNTSPDGQIIMVSPSPWGNYCFMWTMDGGWGTEVGASGTLCHVTNDGDVAGSGPNYDLNRYDPGYWAGEANVWNLIPTEGYEDCGGSPLSVHGVSNNQDYLVGLGWENCRGRRFIYSRPDDTTQVLPCMTNDSCRINDATDDGDTIGWNTSQCGLWRGAETVDGTYDWIDGLGELQRKVCTEGGPCCGDNDCPEFVDDSTCNNVGSCDITGVDCVAGVCTAGANAGETCSGYWQCNGYCTTGPSTGNPCRYDSSCQGNCVGGPNDGDACTGSYYCPDTPHCVDNPEFDPMDLEFYKGEGYKTTPDGDYSLGYNFGQSPYDWSHPEYDWTLWSSAYRGNPDGSFSQIAPPDSGYEGDSWTPLNMSDDGNVVVGRYGWWIYSFPTLWTPGTGTLDLQYFLIAQGLDELWFWQLASLNAVSADGTVVGGYGTNTLNPDCNSTWGCQEGFVIDISKAKVCHMPGNHNERTLTIGFDSIGDHLGHGDFLGTCEFLNSGGNARWAEQRQIDRPAQGTTPADSNPMFINGQSDRLQQQWAPGQQSENTRPQIERTRTQRSR